jgi:hypothetical protein
VNKTRLSLILFAVMTLAGWQAFAAFPQNAAQDQDQGAAKAEKSDNAPGTRFKTEKGSLSGTLAVVSPDKNFVSIKDASGTTFGFKVKPSTKIMVGGQKAKLADLSSDTNKQATVKFMALRTGDVAQSIDVSQ